MKKTNVLIILLFSLFIGIGVCSATTIPCIPNCAAGCGSDGCGGSCGECCYPSCAGKECGSDGCGGSCGTCPDDAFCCPSGICCHVSAICCFNGCCGDNKCYEPTCINGCGQLPVGRGGTDEACFEVSGCTGHSCKCDGGGKCVAVLIDSIQFCKGIEFSDTEDFTKPVSCISPTSEFLTTDVAAYIIMKLSLLAKDDEITYNVFDPSGAIIDEGSRIISQNMNMWYDYSEIMIADKGRSLGTYSFKIYANGDEIVSGSFMIVEDVSDACTEQGFYCCPEEKTCISPEEVKCREGICCTYETQCQTTPSEVISLETLARTLITNCEETGLNECNRTIRLYDYSIHGILYPEQTVVIEFRDIDIDCYKKEDITIAYYDETAGVWIEKNTYIEQVSKDLYRAKAQINSIGYIALLRTEACVPVLCTYGGYRTDPIGGYVNVEEPITFELCSMVSGCEALKNNVCNKNCPERVDPDCDECTSEAGDCCLISYDDKCDKDCAPYVDPDCCRKSDELCCAGGSDRSNSESCDKNCDTGGAGCTSCKPAGGDCCSATADGVCDPDCPKLSNGVGYLDIDCCASNGISATNNKGDCCNTAQDGVCDCDCIAGLDPDCVILKDCCGNNLCASSESPSSCPSDCRCGDGICSHGKRIGFLHLTGDENCANCPADCGECPPPLDYGAY